MGSSLLEGTRGEYNGGVGSTVGSVWLGGRLYMGFVLGSDANFLNGF